ncbi:hypothetical protein A3D85_01155 [Candidatus Amesbacteria bacterium RIFCSPHIGHO2_02_FULL_47_9]|uniref:cysteine desulfurase n=1 Tax=Candidatus Amesbacteria bacterium RIFCSPHIGHO2_01_FULL_48_32b TaxID=1797253 RepID=A0A1F4YD91_9BACT|nr:MAG: hypothetical protein A2876_03260 [Candidatus Amesbacteria bacterium RIFCSPHIGHO2_01_FULL_48_32b]OGD02953.1 MAG: hypothetical protein A3D85_01155 [Candidatus Amesbacteria bacterium RIFCSPHIGHO2_02_FULL_47_9]
MLDVKKDFPILKKNIVYLDSAATSQKPLQVINAVSNYYRYTNANIHRGIYKLAQRSSRLIDSARAQIAKFIGADPGEIIFVRGTTEAVNFIASRLSPKIVTLSVLEHHSNLVPWQQSGAILKFINIDNQGHLLLESLDPKTRFITITGVSNLLGTITPLDKIRKICPQAQIFVDGAQLVPHFPVEVHKLGIDFLAFSGHKMLGPTGIGVLYINKSLLNQLPPWLYGGDMIDDVTLNSATWADPPQKFEAGTLPLAEIVGLGAAVDYLQKIGMVNVRRHEEDLTNYALAKFKKLKNIVTLYGPTTHRAGIITFNVNGIHAHDAAQVLDEYGICVRSGQHCATPAITRFGVPAMVRASFYIYNTKSDIDYLISKIPEVYDRLHRDNS